MFFSLILKVYAQSETNFYLNKVGFCNLEVGYDVHVDGNYAYVTNNDGVMAIDIIDPENPEKIGEIIVDDASGFVIEHEIAYIAAASGGFIIADVSDPTLPVIIGQNGEGGAYKIAILGSYAYVSYLESGFKVFDISDPSNPIPIGEFSDTRSDDIQVKNDVVYFANAEAGLKVIDASDQNSPQFVRTLPHTTGATDIHINNNLLFLACWGNGVKVFDISDPLSPLRLDSYVDNDGGEELGLVEKEGLLYVADNYGIELFNVSDPTSITKITENRDSIAAAHDIDVDENYIYVAIGGGLLILELSTEIVSDFPPFLYYLIPILIISIVGVLITVYFKVLRKKNV
jgi:hypothetical protein